VAEKLKKSAAELFREREKRIQDAIALKMPDRVPVVISFAFYAARHAGITYREAMFDPVKAARAWSKTINDFQADTYENPFGNQHGGMLAELADYKMLRWPGHGVGENSCFQYLDFENLKADEYDEFLFDPTYFMIRKFWPRVFGNLEAFKNFPAFRMMYQHGSFNALAPLNAPEMKAALTAMNRLTRQAAKNARASAAFAKKMEGLGFPPVYGPSAIVPFDLISDQFRGTRGAMLDMYRQPDKLLAATEKVLPMILENTINAAKNNPCKRIFIPLHKGQEFFMSIDQYKKFYWPGFKGLMLGLINNGLTPCPLVEGEYTSRLEILADVPPGKVCYHFEQVDYVKAKEVLKGIACIRGGIPITLMVTGRPEEVRERAREMIKVVGNGGGFIMSPGVNVDDSNEENIRALIETTKEYGVYR
jgi:uroporphyrinogen-III decarboxylase